MQRVREYAGWTLGIWWLFFGCSTAEPVRKNSDPQYVEDGSFAPRAVSPAFTDRHPRLCFDQGHHNLAIRKERYQPILGLLESDGFQIHRLESSFQKNDLKSCDILYISAALGFTDTRQRELARRPAFTKDEIRAISEWVKEGGGIFLATDHRPMADSMESLVEAFGVEGSILSVRAPRPMEPFQESGIFEISGEQLTSDHPVIRGRDPSEQVKRLFWFYGGSFKPVQSSDSILRIGSGFKFVDSEDESKKISDYSALGVAMSFGKGRMIAVGDGTMLTSKFDTISGQRTGINRPGSDNVQFSLNAFRWLVRLY